MKKRFGFFALLFVTVLLCAVFDFSASATTYSGSCGERVEWSLDTSTGVLEITGVGEMQDYTTYLIPWYDYGSSIKTVWISPGVTRIGSYAFTSCNLMSIDIPDSVKSIGAWAFSCRSGLTRIDIPDSVTTIEDCAFNTCTGLTNLVIPDSVTSIGVRAFEDCSNLTEVTMGNGVTSIGYGAFSGCSGLTNITIPGSVTSIGERAFFGCSSMKTLTLGKLFSGNMGNVFPSSQIEEITLSDSITSIREFQFSGCDSLKRITIGRGVTDIQGCPFPFCSSLESIIVSSANPKYHSRDNCLIETASHTLIAGCKGSTIPGDGSVTVIGGWAFYGSGLTAVTIPACVTSIGELAFTGCSALESITVADGNPKFHSSNNCLIATGNKILIAGCKNSVIPTDGSVTVIGDSAFRSCGSLTELLIPDGVTTIRDYAFSWCDQLKSVVFPDSVKSIGYDIFQSTGNVTVTCNCSAISVISYMTKKSIPLQLLHSTVTDIIEEPTCCYDGKATVTCTVCGLTLQTEILPAAHRESDWIWDVPVTPESDGIRHRVCTVCEKLTSYEIVPAHRHEYGNGVCTVCGDPEPTALRGDFDGNGKLTSADAVWLLRHVMIGEVYPIGQSGDVNGDGTLNSFDAVYLLRHVMIGDLYPLK